MRYFWLIFIFTPCVVLLGKVRICLSVPIGQNTATLEQCLDNVEKWVDCIAFCNSKTIAQNSSSLRAAENFLNKTGIPGIIDFCEEGAFSFSGRWKAIRDLLSGQNFSFSDTYVLFLDSDSVLKLGDTFNVDGLKEDLYSVLEKSDVLSCYEYFPRLVRAEKMENFSEFLSEGSLCRRPPQSTKLRNAYIEKASDKFLQNDLEMLELAYQRDPQNSRIIFSLAQAYRALGRFEDAIRHYEARIAVGGKNDEVWFSQYRIAQCHQDLGNWEQAFFGYLEALEKDPSRAESLLAIASHYRDLGKNQISYLFAKHGSRIPYPSHSNLFPFFCNYHFEQELSISSYYTRFREEGFQACNELVIKPHVPASLKDQTYRNLLFYVQKLKNVRYRPIRLDLSKLDKAPEEKYHPMNPSIAKFDHGYEVICRAVNYTQTGAKHFHTSDPDGIYRSVNFFLSFDKDFKLLSQEQVFEELERERIPRLWIEGMEDCRIFPYQNGSWFTCTNFDTNPTGNLQIGLCKLSNVAEDGERQVESLLPLIGPDLYRCEKNWLPFVHKGQIHVIYSYDPFIIYKPDLQTGECHEVVRYEPLHDFSRFRGSAAPVQFDDGYLMMVHEVVFMPEFERCYLHRFLYLDQDFHIQTLSKPFIFDHFGVEFCCGMTYTHAGDELVMAIGSEDKEALLGFVDLETVRSLLEPLPPVIENPLELK